MIKCKADFLSNLFLIPMSEIVEWNCIRNKHDKKQFVHFLDTLYDFYLNVSVRGPPSSPSCPVSTPEDDQVVIPGFGHSCASTGLVKGSIGSSSMSSVISRTNRHDSEQGSCTDGTTPTTLSYFTSLSQISPTTSSLSISGPLAIYTTDYKQHKRARAANRRVWNPRFNHLTSTPESPIFPASRANASRSVPRSGETTSSDISNIQGVFSPSGVPLVREFLRHVSDTQKHDFSRSIRALQSLRRLTHYDSVQSRDFCLGDDSAIWSPRRALPVIAQKDIFRSTIPIGVSSL